VRIDRLDELDDGSCAVFDYKTGRAVSVDWLAERIGNPQLLVYSLAAGARVTALAMVHLTPRHIAYRGMADRRDRLPRIDAPAEPALWPRQIERWEQAVGRLAREFLRGAAAADPLGDACATCHLHGFCRIAERHD
jgi:RecB family exonuclease